MLSRIILLIGLAVLLLTGLFLSQRKSSIIQISGIVEADEIRLGSRIGGRVKAVHVQEGMQVKAGELLVELEPFDLDARLAQAQAVLAGQKSALAKLESGLRPEEISQAEARVNRLTAELDKLVAGPRHEEIETARAWVELAEAQRLRAKQSHDRATELYKRDPANITREDLDAAIEGLRVAESTLMARKEQLQLLTNGTRIEDLNSANAQLAEAKLAYQLATQGFREEEKEEARAQVQAAQASVATIQAQIAELKIIASVAGVVSALELQPGDIMPPNSPALTLLDENHLWLRSYIAEDLLSWKVGDSVEITVDSFPGKKFEGQISYISSQGEFTPRNVQTPEERAKQVYRIKVQLPNNSGLRVGMGADVWLPRR